MKSRDGKSQRREEERISKKRKSQKKDREKVGKSRNTVFFEWFVAPEGRKVGSLKWRVRSQLARWEMKNCTPLWREANFQVKMYKAPQLRSTFRSCDVEKVHAVVARSTFASEKAHVRSTFGRWDVEKVHAVAARSTFRSQNVPFSDHLEVEMSQKCTPLWREAHFEVKMLNAPHVRTTFGRLDVVPRGRPRDYAPGQKWAKREGFVAFPKTMAGVGHLKRICKDAFSVAGAVQKTCSWEMLGGQGADFLRGVAFWSIRSVGLLRWFCVTALRMTWPHFFVAGAVL